MNSSIRESREDVAFNIANYTILIIVLIVVLYPIVYIVSASFSSPSAVVSGRVWLWPVEPTMKGYAAVFKYNAVMKGFSNSIFYTVVGTLLNVVLTIMAAYPLSRKDFVGRSLLMFIFTFTILFNGGLIPTYLLVKDLGLLDTRWSLIFPVAVTVINVIIARTYFQITIPQEMLESAQTDGCTDIKFLARIALPLSGPIIAVMVLFYAVGHWNSYFNAIMYLNDRDLYPLQVVLRSILIMNQVDSSMLANEQEILERQGLADLLKYSLIVISTLPMMIIYPFVQKHFVKGVMLGSLKG